MIHADNGASTPIVKIEFFMYGLLCDKKGHLFTLCNKNATVDLQKCKETTVICVQNKLGV